MVSLHPISSLTGLHPISSLTVQQFDRAHGRAQCYMLGQSEVLVTLPICQRESFIVCIICSAWLLIAGWKGGELLKFTQDERHPIVSNQYIRQAVSGLLCGSSRAGGL